jgi:hypothetical protein
MSIICTVKSFSFGLDGLTLFVETPWLDVWAGRRCGILRHERG